MHLITTARDMPGQFFPEWKMNWHDNLAYFNQRHRRCLLNWKKMSAILSYWKRMCIHFCGGWLTCQLICITTAIGLSQKRPLWSKAWCCVRLKFCSKLDDWGGKSYRRFGVNRNWQFQGGKSYRWFGGKSYLAIWGVNCLYDLPPPRNHQILCGHMGLFFWHLV